MKGIFFRSFIEFAEQKFGLNFVDQMIEAVAIDSCGVYTNVGKYNHQELLNYFSYISHHKSYNTNEIAKEFGLQLFEPIIHSIPHSKQLFTDCFHCLHHLENSLSKQIKKLYIDADFPTLSAISSFDNKKMTITYSSSRPFVHMWHGMIIGCINFFKESITVHMQDCSAEDQYRAIFTLKRP